ncbi:MAG: hypothetical protein U1E62_08185 [Alsobacter sp.]
MFAFIADPARDEKVDLVAQLLDRLGYVVARFDGIPELARSSKLREPGHNLIVIPDSAVPTVPVQEVVDLVAATRGGTMIIYLADAIDPDDYKALVRTGAADWVKWSSALAELRDISMRRRALQVEVTEHRRSRPHVVVSFLGACGGVGSSTLALETGIFIAQQKGKSARSVAVVDLDPFDSLLCDYVDLTPRVKLSEIARDPERLDDYLLDIFTTRHPSGLHLFACEREKLDLASVDPVAVYTLLNRLVEKYETVLVDAGARWAPWTDGILANSDRVFLISRYTIPSAKKAITKLAGLASVGIERKTIVPVINFCKSDIFGRPARRKEIDPLFAPSEPVLIVADHDVATDCNDTGESIIQGAPRSSLSRDIRKLAEAVLSVERRPS